MATRVEAPYSRRLVLSASAERAYEAIAEVDGLRGWWTTIVDRTAADELHFRFEGLDEEIVMRVEGAVPGESVHWRCLRHTSQSQWDGTQVVFELSEGAPGQCGLSFRHSGLPAEVVERGWNHFLASLAGYVERGAGTPYGAT